MAKLLPTLEMTVALALTVLSGLASAGDAPQETAVEGRQKATLTGKERLSGKAADEQRVDNCKVPLNLRGPKPRPEACSDGASGRPKR
jgi:hypothetical protein